MKNSKHRPFGAHCLLLSKLAALLVAILCVPTIGRCDDAAIAKELATKDVKITAANGIATEIDVHEPTKLTDDDFSKIAQLVHLKKLQFGRGLTNKQLAALTALPDVTWIVSNGSNLDDDGIAQCAQFKKLQRLTVYHQNRSYKGTSLDKLASLPNFENLTMSGNVITNDAFAAIAKLEHLKYLGSWHNRADPNAISLLKNFSLTSVFLGDPLVGDETVSSLAAIKSLESITLMEAHFSYETLSQFKQLPALKHLTLTEIDISESDLQKLKQLLPTVQIKWTAPGPQAQKRIQAQNEKKTAAK